jgi:preprotein translocase subunit SecE
VKKVAKNNVPAKKEAKLKGRLDNGIRYLKSVYNELRKVHWPGKQQLLAYTGVVILAVSLVGLIIWLFDIGLSFLLQKLFEVVA